MDMTFKEKFLQQWDKHFPGADLPITFYYTDDPDRAELVAHPEGFRCVIAQLGAVRNGKSRSFNAESLGCRGGARYFGFSQEIMPKFEYFLSCGIPGRLEGERYKKSPEIVQEVMKQMPAFKAPARYLVSKRWDQLESEDEPEVIVFFAEPDVLAGLFTLANFDDSDLFAVVTPFSAGCGAIVLYPYAEKDADHPRAVVGMFDVSARPFVPSNRLTFALPMDKFVRMVDNMDESFLITRAWERVKTRIEKEVQPTSKDAE